MKPVLYQFRISPFCDKVRRVMKLKGMTWDTVEVSLLPSAAHKRISPTGKFPAADFGGRIVVDSSDIVAEIDRLIPDPPLLPADPKQRADALLLEDWADESLYFFETTMRNWPQNRARFFDDLLHAESGIKRTIMAWMIPGAVLKQAKAQGLGRKTEAQVVAQLAQHYDSLSAKLDGGKWLVGDRISIADITVRSMVFVLDRTTEGKRLSDARPAITDWSCRVDALTL